MVGKGGTAGFLGRAYDPYYLYPTGDDMDMAKMIRIKVDDLQLRPEVSAARLEQRAELRDVIAAGMPDLERATARYDLDEYYTVALSLVISGRARDAFDLSREAAMREHYGMNTFGQSLFAGPAAGRGRHPRRRSQLAQGRQLATIIRGTCTPVCRAA